ncbi:MAG: methionyl aminopeptidase [Cyanobacteria bacterium P01_H01_bin.74]
MPLIKNKTDLNALHQAGSIVKATLDHVVPNCQPGISTLAIDTEIKKQLTARKSSLPFNSVTNSNNARFGFASCTSVNDEIVNGIPAKDRLLKTGDILSIATAASCRGIHAKAAITVYIANTQAPANGEKPEAISRLLLGTKMAVTAVATAYQPGFTLKQLLQAIPQTAVLYQLSVLEELGGQEIGKKLHGPLPTPNNPEELPDKILLEPGMAFTIMPMFGLGKESRVIEASDDWTYKTADKTLSAHFADTFLVTDAGLENITQLCV